MSPIRLSYWPLFVLALWGCHMDVEQFQPYAPSVEDINSVLADQVPAAQTQSTFILNYLASDKVLETPGGSRIFLIDADHLFADAVSGLPVLCSTCPELKIEVTEVIDKSDILARGLNTISVSGLLFESGGMINVTVTCNGQLLTLLPDRTLKIQIPNNDPQSGFFVFNQAASVNGEQKWENSSQEVFEAEWPVLNTTPQRGYELLVRDLGWTACGRMINDPASTFCIELPSGFADQNTLAYIVFKNQAVVAPLQYSLEQNKFCYPNAPAGYQIQLVAISKLGGQYWLGNAQTEIGTNATVPLATHETTEEAVLNFVKSL